MQVRPTPVAACGIVSSPTPIRNSIECVLMDVEQYNLVGEVSNSALSALVESMDSELLVHPVGQFVAIRKIPVPHELMSIHAREEAAARESLVLAKPWPRAFMYLNGSGTGQVHCGVTAICIAPNKKVIAVCERLRIRGATEAEKVTTSGEGSTLRQESEEPPQKEPADTVPADAAAEDKAKSEDAIDAQISIYHITSGKVMKRLACPTNGAEWIGVAFSADSSQIVTVSDEQPESNLILWQWRSGRRDLIARGIVPSGVLINRIRAAPRIEPPLVISTTAPGGHLGFWAASAEETIIEAVESKPNVTDGSKNASIEKQESRGKNMEGILSLRNLAGGSGSSGENFMDHLWLDLKVPGNENYPVLAAVTDRDTTDPSCCAIHFLDIDGTTLDVVKVPLPDGGRQQRGEVICATPAGVVVAGPGGFVCALSVATPVKRPSDDGKGPAALSPPKVTLLGAVSFVEAHAYHACTYLPLQKEVLLATRNGSMFTLPYAKVAPASTQSSGNALDAFVNGVPAMAAAEAAEDDDYDEDDLLTRLIRGKKKEPLTELLTNGTHDGPILCVDAAVQKPLAVTVGTDRKVRVWNYLTSTCEICVKFTQDEPVCGALHPSGCLLAVGSLDRLRVYSIMHGPPSLSVRREWQLKNTRFVAFSHGGNQLGAAVGINVMIFDSHTLEQMFNFAGHTGPIKTLVWTGNDRAVYSTGIDGNIYGWDLTYTRQNPRLDDAGQLNRTSGYLDMVVRLSTDDDIIPPEPKDPLDDDDADDDNNFSFGSPPSLKSPLHADGRLSLEIDGARPGSAGPLTDDSGASSSGEPSGPLSYVVVSGAEGGLRELRWDRLRADSYEVREFGTDGSAPVLTSLELDVEGGLLYAGTISGALRVYEWPLSHVGAFTEFPAHANVSDRPTRGAVQIGANDIGTGGIASMQLVRGGKLLLSGGEDGAFLVQGVVLQESDSVVEVRSLSSCMPHGSDELHEEFNVDSVLVHQEFIEELYREKSELSKLLHDLANDLEFGLHRKDTEWMDKLKKAQEERDVVVSHEKDRCEKVQADLHALRAKQLKDVDTVDKKHVGQISALENGYEAKLGTGMARYETMRKKIGLVRSEAVTKLTNISTQQSEELRLLQSASERRWRELDTTMEQKAEECRTAAKYHRAALLQQEEEYEAEVGKLMDAASKELSEQRQHTAQLRGKTQLANTKTVQMERRMREMSEHKGRTEEVIKEVVNANDDLAASIAIEQENIAEKQATLNQIEGDTLALSEEHKRLDAFRSVLDSKLHTMHEERGPLTEHIGRLDVAKQEIYNVLIQGFKNKAKSAAAVAEKTAKEESMERAVANYRAAIRDEERTISSFKRELSMLVETISTPEETAKDALALARRYLSIGNNKTKKKGKARGGGGEESSTVGESSSPGRKSISGDHGGGVSYQADQSEAMRAEMQAVLRERDLLTTNTLSQKAAVERSEQSAKRAMTLRANEGKWMIDECNRLRRENINVRREEFHLERQLEAWAQRFMNSKNEMSNSSIGDGSTTLDIQLSVGDEHSLSNVTGPAVRGASPPHHLGTPIPPAELHSQRTPSPPDYSVVSASTGGVPGAGLNNMLSPIQKKRMTESGEFETDGGQSRISRGSNRSRSKARSRIKAETKALAVQIEESRKQMKLQEEELKELRKTAKTIYQEGRRSKRKTRAKVKQQIPDMQFRDPRAAAMEDDGSSQVSALSGSTRYYPQFSQPGEEFGPFNDRPVSGGGNDEESFKFEGMGAGKL